MAKSFQRRITQAETIAADAIGRFEKAAEDLEMAARLQRSVYDDLQTEIDRLTVQASEAQAQGQLAQRRAEKLRALFD